MKIFIPALLILSLGAVAQTRPATPAAPPLPDIPDESVIAVFDDGTPFTMQDFKMTMGGLPEANQQMARMNRKGFVEWWAGIRKMAQLGEQQKLDQQSPTKEKIAFNRTTFVADAMMNAKLISLEVPEEDVAKSYEANKERYKVLRLKAIYIAFGGAAAPGKKPLTEEEARKKAMSLLAQIRAGADFVKLVKENSDDAASREKNGDFGAFSATDGISDAIRKSVFSLKQGDVSEPVLQANGFYLLRVEDIDYSPLKLVHNQIWTELRQQMYNKWMTEIAGSVKVTFPAPAFVDGAPAPAGK
jgi:peptidyl-prolyl cis-trans isomerase C